ncbi:ATP-binding protein [Aquipuribacter sp. MA13-6]|uniref:ATP-binding protein n=1 Tax=unclassified Aquipuribacter TaxID=2635084 RepID=UPI003EE838F5
MTAPATIELLPQAVSARQARRWVTERMSGYGLEPLCDAVELLTAEVVTNALLHAGTQLSLHVRRQGSGVHVEVMDGSSVPPHRQHFSRTATTGRGIGLLDDLADEWGWRPEKAGKTVWFRVLRPRETWSAADLHGFGDLGLEGLERT